ncbi:hypothetical protein [Sulfurospirillum sp. UCH001]|uniref:hypothetical protein n=1 Tax=Sulfurospirillum sp. UCH001 TaxID=1581011 RepID=UPI00082B5E8F|nr:hypothetical protein [Sulfurospirillum sp. UCH001]
MSKKAFLFLIFLILSFQSMLIACGGSCLECHSKLQPYINDQNHVILNECITCHNKPSEQGQCGKDCFDCHSRDKVYAQKDVVAHQELKICGTCHKEKVDFTIPKRSAISNQQNLIQLFK